MIDLLKLKVLLNKLKNYQSRMDAVYETKEMLNSIKITGYNYDLDSRIRYLDNNNIKVKYKGL